MMNAILKNHSFDRALAPSPGNDNDRSRFWGRFRFMHEPFDHYDEVGMTAFGPIGIMHGQGFEYLDPEIRAWRSQ